MHTFWGERDRVGCQRVVLDAPLSPVQSRPLICAAGCLIDAPSYEGVKK